MNLNFFYSRLAAGFATGLFILAGGLFPAAADVFMINTNQSYLILSGSIVGSSFLPQGAGSLTTTYGGNIDATQTVGTIQFTGASLIVANTNGNWSPLPGGDTPGVAPADYGALVSTFITANTAFRSLLFDVTSSVIPVTNGQFNPDSLTFLFPATATSTLDYEYTGAYSGSGTQALTGSSTNNVNTNATLTTVGTTQTLTLGVNVSFTFTLVTPNDTIMNLSGQIVATRNTAAPAPYDAIYTFGDSWTDTGRNPPSPATNYYDGRWSNGPLWVEFITSELGLTFSTVNNFAVAGSDTAQVLNQVNNRPTLSRIPTSLFVIWAGGVDFLQNLNPAGTTNDPLWGTVITNAVDNLSNAVSVLQVAGAHTIIVPNLQDISKLPVMSSNSIAYRGYINGKVGQFNTLLASTLNSIREANPGLVLIDADINTPLNNLIANPAAAGFTQATVDVLDDTNLTDKSFTGPGSDYVFWNPDHPTSKTHQLIASWIYASQQLIGPIPLSFQHISNSLVLSWTNSAFALQSAPATTGTYTNIPGATSPYTNPITSGQQFFRLLNP